MGGPTATAVAAAGKQPDMQKGEWKDYEDKKYKSVKMQADVDLDQDKAAEVDNRPDVVTSHETDALVEATDEDSPSPKVEPSLEEPSPELDLQNHEEPSPEVDLQNHEEPSLEVDLQNHEEPSPEVDHVVKPASPEKDFTVEEEKVDIEVDTAEQVATSMDKCESLPNIQDDEAPETFSTTISVNNAAIVEESVEPEMAHTPDHRFKLVEEIEAELSQLSDESSRGVATAGLTLNIEKPKVLTPDPEQV